MEAGQIFEHVDYSFEQKAKNIWLNFHIFCCLYFYIILQGNKFIPCRHDWHQTGGQITITIYAKNSIPEQSYVEANSTVVCFTMT